jgi:hypothetical protein
MTELILIEGTPSPRKKNETRGQRNIGWIELDKTR